MKYYSKYIIHICIEKALSIAYIAKIFKGRIGTSDFEFYQIGKEIDRNENSTRHHMDFWASGQQRCSRSPSHPAPHWRRSGRSWWWGSPPPPGESLLWTGNLRCWDPSSRTFSALPRCCCCCCCAPPWSSSARLPWPTSSWNSPLAPRALPGAARTPEAQNSWVRKSSKKSFKKVTFNVRDSSTPGRQKILANQSVQIQLSRSKWKD